MGDDWNSKLRDPRWQKRRFDILTRDKWRCRLCFNDKRSLDVHHIVYGRESPWDSTDEELILLCNDCHGMMRHVDTPEQGEAFAAWVRNANLQARALIANGGAITRTAYQPIVADVPPWM